MASNSHRRYDLSMSRRTRRPAVVFDCSPDETCQEKEEKNQEEAEDDTSHHSSLKDLFEGVNEDEGERLLHEKHDQEGVRHQNQMQLAVAHGSGIKFKGMMSRYVKVLKHMIRTKHRSKKRTITAVMK